MLGFHRTHSHIVSYRYRDIWHEYRNMKFCPYRSALHTMTYFCWENVLDTCSCHINNKHNRIAANVYSKSPCFHHICHSMVTLHDHTYFSTILHRKAKFTWQSWAARWGAEGMAVGVGALTGESGPGRAMTSSDAAAAAAPAEEIAERERWEGVSSITGEVMTAIPKGIASTSVYFSKKQSATWTGLMLNVTFKGLIFSLILQWSLVLMNALWAGFGEKKIVWCACFRLF